MAVAFGIFGAISIEAPSVHANPLDVCQMTAWDSTGRVLHDGDVVGGDGTFSVIFRIEDDPFGYLSDFLDGPVQDLIQPLKDSIAQLQQQVTTQQAKVDNLQSQLDALNLGDPGYAALLTQLTNAKLDVKSTQTELDADLEVLKEFNEALNHFHEVDLVAMDANNGSALITSRLEVTGFEWVKPRVAHMIEAPVTTQKVDHVWPNWLTDPDGHDLDSISLWLQQVANVPAPAGIDANNVCGAAGTVDGWGYVDMKCATPGDFHVNVTPFYPNTPSTVHQGTIRLVCPGVVDKASISTANASLEVQPVGANVAYTTLTVATEDEFGKRFDGGHVTWQTDNCMFVQADGATAISPTDGGTVVENYSNTFGPLDAQFLAANPQQTQAGTAEVVLDCSNAKYSHAGTANVQAIVDRPGADVVLTQAIKVVGPPDKLSFTLQPTALTCGDPVTVSATVTDSLGNPVSDGTLLDFATDKSTGVSGGAVAGANGQSVTVGGTASVLLATDPSNPGKHTVTASTIGTDKYGRDEPAIAATLAYECSAPSSQVSAEVKAPELGGGVSNFITPPNTGDAGLNTQAGQSSSAGLTLAICGGLILLVAGLGWRIRAVGSRR